MPFLRYSAVYLPFPHSNNQPLFLLRPVFPFIIYFQKTQVYLSLAFILSFKSLSSSLSFFQQNQSILFYQFSLALPLIKAIVLLILCPFTASVQLHSAFCLPSSHLRNHLSLFLPFNSESAPLNLHLPLALPFLLAKSSLFYSLAVNKLSFPLALTFLFPFFSKPSFSFRLL